MNNDEICFYQRLRILVFFSSVISFFFFYNSVNGQSRYREGYIVTLNQDTISKMIVYRSGEKNYLECSCKGEKGLEVYFPNQIRGYGYDDDSYFSSQVIDSCFVEVLVEGRLSLYKAGNHFLMVKDSTVFRLSNNESKVYVDGVAKIKEDKKWRGIVSFLIHDCSLSSNNMLTENSNLREKTLTNIVVAYNNCFGVEIKEYRGDKAWTTVNFGLSVGLTKSYMKEMTYSDYSDYFDQFNEPIDLSVGLIIKVSSPRISDKLSFLTGLTYSNSSFSSYVDRSHLYTQIYSTIIDLKTLTIPLTMEYAFMKRRTQNLFLQGGFNCNLYIDSDVELDSDIEYGKVVEIQSKKKSYPMDKNLMGVMGGFGVERDFNRFKGCVAFNYCYLPYFNKTGYFGSSEFNKYGINLILFKK